MAIQTIRRIPNKLPHASIYLDDLYEIETVFSNASKKCEGAPQIIRFEYEVDGSSLTTHEDLEKHEGYSSNFSLNIVIDSWPPEPPYTFEGALRFSSSLNPSFLVPSRLKEQGYEIFARVEQIFNPRCNSFTTICKSITGAHMLSILILICIPCILILLRATALSTILLLEKVTKVVAVVVLTVFAVIVVGNNRDNRIYFRHARQDEKERITTRNKRIEQVILLAAGAVFGALATVVVNYFTKK